MVNRSLVSVATSPASCFQPFCCGVITFACVILLENLPKNSCLAAHHRCSNRSPKWNPHCPSSLNSGPCQILHNTCGSYQLDSSLASVCLFIEALASSLHASRQVHEVVRITRSTNSQRCLLRRWSKPSTPKNTN